jgi:hypothetical protein
MLPIRLREYAALTNSPILYWLTFEVYTHRIGSKWAYLWLIDFARSPGLVAFHPKSLRLITENLPLWESPYSTKNDFELFLDGAFPNMQDRLRQLITQAIQNDRVLYKDETSQEWTSSYE